MLNILLLPWFQLILLAGGIILGGCLQAAEKLKSCQTHEGSWLECPTKINPGKTPQSGFAFKKAEKAAKSKSPLVLLAGGPGQAATEAFLPMSPLLTDLNRSFDLIFFDPRGTAKPSQLSCPMLSSIDLGPMTDRAGQVNKAIECVEKLGRSQDLNLMGTDLSVKDLEDIRIDMGYEKLSLYGVSYGTRLALRYAALYPDRVEKIILEGVLPPESLIGQDTYYLEPVLKKISNRCWSTEDCKTAYGDPWSNYQKLIADYQSEKSIQVAHPRTGEIQTIKMQSAMIDSMIISLLYSEFDHSMIPGLLFKAARGDFGPLIAAGFGGSRTSTYEALYYATACREDVPFYDKTKINERAQLLQKICASYPFQAVDKSFHNTFKGNWPMLLLSGELDPVTAPSLVADLKTNFPNATQIIVPGKGHNVFYLKCVSRQIKAFLTDSSKTKDQEILPCEDSPLPFLLPEPKP